MGTQHGSFVQAQAAAERSRLREKSKSFPLLAQYTAGSLGGPLASCAANKPLPILSAVALKSSLVYWFTSACVYKMASMSTISPAGRAST